MERKFQAVQNLFERSARKPGARDQFVQLVNVGLVMLAVMIFKRLRGDMGLQRVDAVWEIGNFECHR